MPTSLSLPLPFLPLTLILLLLLNLLSPTLSAQPSREPYTHLSHLAPLLLQNSPTPRLSIDDVAQMTPLPSQNATSSSDPSTNRLSAEPCVLTSQCKSPRQCIRVTDNTILRCPSDASVFCFCFPLQLPTCKTSADCEPKELCTRFADDDDLDTICLSEYVVSLTNELQKVDGDDKNPTPKSPDEVTAGKGGGCVDVRALEGRPLVYARHRRRVVLCDSGESCATPGHVVVWKGTAMMMKSYCALVRCQRSVIWVNSPTYARGLRVASRTGGLEYTAFAAKYETTVEERALAVAVRAGF